MKTIKLTIELKLEDFSKTPEGVAKEVYDALSNNYVFDVEEECVVTPAEEATTS